MRRAIMLFQRIQPVNFVFLIAGAQLRAAAKAIHMNSPFLIGFI